MRMSNDFGPWLKHRIRHVLKLDQKTFGELMGVDQSSVSRWINGASIETKRLALMAKLLRVSNDELLTRIGGEEVPSGARAVDEDQAHYEWVPITGAAAAGPRRTVNSDDYVILPPKRSRRYPGRRQSLEVRGDCLLPDIHPGSQVIIDPDIPWRPGQTIALKVEGGVQVKRLLSMGDGRLVLGSRHGEMILPDGDASILGVVIAMQRFFEV
jgi:SOS-response transcriptional repressor LexA